MITTKFPFGKFKDLKIEEIDTPYLVFALENYDLSKDLKVKIHTELMYKLKSFDFFENILYDAKHSNVIRESTVEKLLMYIAPDRYITENESKIK